MTLKDSQFYGYLSVVFGSIWTFLRFYNLEIDKNLFLMVIGVKKLNVSGPVHLDHYNSYAAKM